MRRRSLFLVSALLLTATPAAGQDPPTPPAVEIHRTAAASHWDPAAGELLFVLAIGSDVREGDPSRGRADTLRLIALHPATMQGTTVGIPRDAFVDVPGHGMMKITESLYRGGPAKTVETVQNLLGRPIHYWAMVDFSRFRELVNRLGGVVVHVPYPMNDGNSGARFDAGPHHMNGGAALAFSRVRYGVPGGDFGRSENHGRMLLAGLAKFHAEAQDPMRLLAWLNVFRELVSTNVPPPELMRLALLGRRLDPGAIRNVVLPGRPGGAGGQSVVFLDPHAGAILASLHDDALV